LLVAPVFLIEAFFVRGAFLQSDAEASGGALFHYAWGVPAFVLIKVLAPAYLRPGRYQDADAASPSRPSPSTSALGAGLFFWLSAQGQLGFIGLAIATSVAAWVNALLLATTLAARGWYRPGPVLVSRTLRALIASGLMAGSVWFMVHNFQWLRDNIVDSRALAAAIVILAGGLIYAVAAFLTGAIRPRDITGALRR
jgi:putative peptidoglycan lipid II flippase